MLKPLDPLDLPEHQRVQVTIDAVRDEPSSDALRSWLGVYERLTEEEIAQVETIALDRRNFMAPD